MTLRLAAAFTSSSGAWDGIPGQADAWPSNLRVEFHNDDGRTRLVVRKGPHPPGTADLGHQAWQMMLPKLESLLNPRPGGRIGGPL